LKVVIFGAGGEEATLRGLIRELGLESTAILPGYDPDAAQKLGLLDVFILPSNYEGLPMVLIEAMAAGVPSVTTDFASAGEVIDPGRDGLIVPRGDAEALAAAIRGLWQDAGLRERLGTQGRLTVHERFSMSRHWQRLREVYASVIGSGTR
jgi:glycosyltransferase involved in cell wall biosynthesis